MFTIAITFREDKHVEYIEMGGSIRMYEATDEHCAEYLKQFPDATAFIEGTNAIPVLKTCTYEIINSVGNVIKTLY